MVFAGNQPEPNKTVVPPDAVSKLAPEIVNEVPPAAVPYVGETENRVGNGM
jgi:hypothetical protein